MKISPARAAAYKILLRIHRDRAFSSVLLAESALQLNGPDRALCHTLVLGVLRNQLYLDALIDVLTNHRQLDLEVRIALRLGLFQIYFFERVPSYASISQTVELASLARKTSAKPFINAVLRKATAGRPELSFGNGIEQLAIETSHPRWLIEKWIGQYGTERAGQIAAAGNKMPALTYRLTSKALKKAFSYPDNWRQFPNIPGCFILKELDDFTVNAQTEGFIYFQNPASFLVAAAVEIPDNGSLLDVCAAPGSKSTAVSMLHFGKNVRIVAGELYRKRVASLKLNAVKQCANDIYVLRYDAGQQLPFPSEMFDVVLVDAPCSGTGTLAANPEIRYFLDPEDIKSLAEKQLRILVNASKVLRRGGRLIYSTCSLEYEEGEGVIGRFLQMEGRNFKLRQIPLLQPFKTPDGFYRTMPDRDEMEGFFVSILEKQ